MLVCQCFAVNHRRVDAAVAAGAVSIGDIAAATDAGAGCGGCHPSLCARIGGNHRGSCGAQECAMAPHDLAPAR